MKNKSIEYVRKKLGLKDDVELHLEHWLRVLEEKKQYADDKVDFNLTTGQPATEDDYQKICEILGI